MIILSAALDLVGPKVPKGVVLLSDVIPSFLAKLLLPYIIQSVPYSIRTIIMSTLSAVGMLLIALTPPYTDGGTIMTKMIGVVLASFSSGMGELSFISLTHFFGPFSLAAWSSGTGGAGLIGAGAYALATTSLGMSSENTLLASAFLPIIMLISFFLILPGGALKKRQVHDDIRVSAADSRDNNPTESTADESVAEEEEGLLSQSQLSSDSKRISKSTPTWSSAFQSNLRRSRSLFFP